MHENAESDRHEENSPALEPWNLQIMKPDEDLVIKKYCFLDRGNFTSRVELLW